MILRPYQKEAHDCILESFETHDTALCVMATSLGKTIVASHVIKYFREFGRIMVVAHREELITQAQDKIHKVTGVESDIEMGESWAVNQGLFSNDVVISTIQTQCAGRESGRMTRFDPNEFSLLVVDEGHHAVSDTWKRVIDYYRQNPKLKVLGLTATPDRTDKEAMGQIFQTVAYAYDIRDGIDDGWLVPIEQQSVFVESLDYSNVKTTAGDLNGKDLAEVLEFEENLHGIADPTIQLTGDRKTLVFAASVAQAERLTEIFNRHKPDSSTFVCGSTPRDIRREIVKAYANDDFQYLVNVGCFTEGFDEPGIKVVVMARPTKSRSLYTQMTGRGGRILTEVNIDQYDTVENRREAIFDSDKPALIVLDFVGNAGRHKLICPADILGGNYPDDVVELAKENAAKESDRTGKPVDVATELQKAEREIAHRRDMEDEAISRDHLLLRAKFSTAKVNPFNILDIDPHKEKSWNKGKPPSNKQLAYLKDMGVDTSGMTSTHAHQVIDTLIKRREAGQCSYKMIKHLQRNGFPPDLSMKHGKVIMAMLVRQGWRPLNATTRNKLKEQFAKQDAENG